MFKNTSSQSVTLYAVDASTGLPKTGDSANMVFYVSKDDGAVTAITSNSGVPTESDSANAKGDYKIALSQAETNADKLRFSGKSTTANIVVVPQTIYTAPANFSALSIASNGHISNVDTLTTYTGDTPQTGDGYARLGAPAGASVSADIAAIKSDTATILTDVNTGAGAIYTRLGAPAGASIAADIAAVEANALAIKTQTDKLTFTVANQVDCNVITKTGFALTSAYDFAKGTVAMIESYAAQGAALTPAQALYQINQHLGESSIASTTKTVKKRDASTTAKSFTLNDAITPTSITETT